MAGPMRMVENFLDVRQFGPMRMGYFLWTYVLVDQSDLIKKIFSQLVSTGLNWSQLDSTGLNWTQLDSTGLNWPQLASTGLHWSQLDSTGLNMSQAAQNHSKVSSLEL